MVCGQDGTSSRLTGQCFLQLTDLSIPCVHVLEVNKSTWVGTPSLQSERTLSSQKVFPSSFNLCFLMKSVLRGCVAQA